MSNHGAANNKLTVNFHPTNPGVYQCKLLLYSPYDVRVFELEGLASAKSTIQTLDFICPSRQSITQIIPITNNTNKDWTLKVNLKQETNGHKCYSGPSEFVATAGKTTNYPLVFKPQWIGQYNGTLTLSNYPMGEWVYKLKGVAEEPLPDDNIVVECRAKTKTTLTLPIKFISSNPNSSVVDYKVESDVAYVSGPSTIQVGINQIVPYELSISPNCSGKFTGSISFVTPEGKFIKIRKKPKKIKKY